MKMASEMLRSAVWYKLKFQRCLLPPLPLRRRQSPLKRWSTSTKLHGTIFQKTVGHSTFISRTLHSSKCTKPSVGRLIWILSVKIIFYQKECQFRSFTFAESVRLLVTATSYDGITDRKQTTLLGILAERNVIIGTVPCPKKMLSSVQFLDRKKSYQHNSLVERNVIGILPCPKKYYYYRYSSLVEEMLLKMKFLGRKIGYMQKSYYR